MIPAEALVMLDTNVLVQLIRGNKAGQRIDEQLRLTERSERPLISVVTVGELRSLARKFGWGERKLRSLSEFVRQLVVVDIGSEAVLATYAHIDYFSEREVSPARRMAQQNDMWIAACAAVYEAHLITTDDDFDHLVPRFLQRTKIHPETGEVRDT